MLLDLLNYQSHHVALVAVEDEEWDDVIQSRFDVRPQDIVNPCKHNHLVYPCVVLAAILVGCRVRCKLRLCNAAIWLPLTIIINGSTVPLAVIVTAIVAHLLLFVDLRTWIVFSPPPQVFVLRSSQK